jgi:poly(A) polymerase
MKKIYTSEEHTLDINKVDHHALYIMEKLASAGHVAYLVGGSVRDLLLGKQPKDFDISTSAEPEEIKKLFRNCILIGRRFRLAHLRFGKKIIEVSTFRTGDPEAETLITRDNQWGSPEDDALRRDFTINGLLYDPATQTIIDYVGGFPDIQKRYLRTIGQPHLRFKQDPVRMIRLLKFQARFGFEVEPQTRVALLESKQEILKSSQARILEELLRMLESGASKAFFHLLTEHGFSHLLLPSLGSFLEGPDHNEVYAYLSEVDSRFEKYFAPPFERPILLSCLLFPSLQKRIRTHYTDLSKVPHLGEILGEIQNLLKETFHPFFHLSKRLRMGIHTILLNQYRFTPLDKKKKYRLRIPKDPCFILALHFFEIRTCLEPGLTQMWKEWNIAFNEAPPSLEPRRNRTSRPRRKPRPRPES